MNITHTVYSLASLGLYGLFLVGALVNLTLGERWPASMRKLTFILLLALFGYLLLVVGFRHLSVGSDTDLYDWMFHQAMEGDFEGAQNDWIFFWLVGCFGNCVSPDYMFLRSRIRIWGRPGA